MRLKPLISIVMVVRNGADTIEKALESVQAQTYRAIDLIVLDGNSTDGTQAIIERYRPILSYYHSRPDKGPSDAANQAYALAKGDIAGMLSCDDWLAPDALETIADMYQKNPEAQVYCFGLEEYEKRGDNFVPVRYYCEPENEHFTLLDSIYCQGLNRFYRIDLLRQMGNFDRDRYPRLADREWYMRGGLIRPQKAQVTKTLYHFLCHSGSYSTDRSVKAALASLEDMHKIAEDYLQAKTLTKEESAWIKDWYCFASVRLLYFTLKAGMPWRAISEAVTTFTRYPLQFLRRIADYRMPAPYRKTLL